MLIVKEGDGMKKISLLVTLLICLCASTVFAYSSTYYPEDVATVMENSMDGDKVIFIGKLTCENEKNETVELKNADEIIILENGKIAERGTHAELLAKKGLYYKTYEAQYGDYHNAMSVATSV